MNFPVRYLPTIGDGSLIALIAIGNVFVPHFAVGGGLLLMLLLLFGPWQPRRAGRPLAVLALAVPLLMGSFQWSRDAAQDPVLAGRELFKSLCYARHTLDGLNNDLPRSSRGMSAAALGGYIGSLHGIRYFMPPVAGTGEERQALTALVSGGLFRPPQPPAGDQRKETSNQLLFEQNCTLCHSSELVRDRTAGWSRERIRRALNHLNQLHPDMPDYRGTPQEKDRLADYIRQLNQPPEEN